MPAHAPPARRLGALPTLTTVAASATALLLATALPASAHVGVSSPDAAPGGFGKLVFRVPTESDTARTTRLTVTLPTETPFAFVTSKPVAGWRVAQDVEELDEPVQSGDFSLDEVVRSVTWTAEEGQGLAPGEFGEFELSVGPFPEEPTTLTLPATQAYSDGTSVAWDEPTEEGGEEPEHPAPTLELTADGVASAAHGGDDEQASATSAATTTPAGSDTTARWLGGSGLALGVLAVGLALLGRGRRTP